MVLHHVPADPETHIQPRALPLAKLNHALQSTGKILSAIGLGAVVLAATATSAGGYTAGSADYGQVISQLQTIATQNQTPIYNDSQYWNGTYALTGSAEQMTAAELGPWEVPESSTHSWIPSYLSDGVDYSVFWDNQPGTPKDVPNSVFNWVQNNNLPTNEVSGNQGVFTDRYDYSVFQSPNGNTYTAWNPAAAGTVSLETPGSADWQAASSSNYLPYSVFKDRTGSSVFENAFGQAYLAETIPLAHTANTMTQQSALTYGASGGTQTSVFQYQGYNPTTGGINDASGYPEQTLSVFTAGTGPQSGNPDGPGSVFVTDDPTANNIGNSVFLDKYGNSYLDDMTADMQVPIQFLQGLGYSGFNQWLETYTPDTGVTLTQNVDQNMGQITKQQPLGLAQLEAYANGIMQIYAPGSTNAVVTPPYNYLTAVAMTQGPTQSPYIWYEGANAGGWQWHNQFAAAMFNPPKIDTTTLKPYLSALSGWKNSTTGQTNFSDAQSNLNNTIQTTQTQMNQYVMTNAPGGTPSATSPATGLQGNFKTVWQLPVNALSESFGLLTDSNTKDTAGTGYVKDNTSLNVETSIQKILTLNDPTPAEEVPLTETSPSLNGGSTLTTSQMTPVTNIEETAATSLYLSGQTPNNQNVTDQGGRSPIITGNTEPILLDPTDGAINSYMTGFVNGMQWFRGQFAWLAQILGWMLELFTVMKCWDLIQWGLNGGPFPLDINLKRPTPKHDSVSEGNGRNSPLNVADNFGRVQQEIGAFTTGTEHMAAATAADAETAAETAVLL